MTHKATTEHNYKKEIMRLIIVGELPKGTGISHVEVYHDDWCHVFQGGYCNCNPEIELRPQTTQSPD